MKTCNIEWLTIPAHNLESTRLFYEQVFGFSVSEYTDRYWVFKAGNIMGGFDADLEPNQKGISFSITVLSISEALSEIEKHGGSILKYGYPLGSGYCAQFKDQKTLDLTYIFELNLLKNLRHTDFSDNIMP
jgi:predicted enzyme related to lactoylglutathione lyase